MKGGLGCRRYKHQSFLCVAYSCILPNAHHKFAIADISGILQQCWSASKQDICSPNVIRYYIRGTIFMTGLLINCRGYIPQVHITPAHLVLTHDFAHCVNKKITSENAKTLKLILSFHVAAVVETGFCHDLFRQIFQANLGPICHT